MAAYVVVHSTIKDPDKMQEYAAAAGPTFASFGGEMLSKGPSEALSGSHGHKIMVVIKFPDRKTALAWYNSPPYQALIPTRTAAMDSVFILGGE